LAWFKTRFREGFSFAWRLAPSILGVGSVCVAASDPKCPRHVPSEVPFVESGTPDRLSQFSTRWSIIQQAHDGTAEQAAAARQEVLTRYGGAVYRYLLSAVRDPHVAEDLTQEFALKFLRGGFHRADAHRGRFRDYLKIALIHLVNDYQRKQRNQHFPLAVDAPEPAAPSSGNDPDGEFVASWREELLDATWNALLQRYPAYHAVLRLRIESPEMTSSQMAEQLTVQMGELCNAAWVRKTLQRAHDKYAELLVDEVAQSLPVATATALREELQELGLLKYCHSVLQGWEG
jgi:RNA polymerase sigma-70 factor (ECF subfamily)